MSELKNDRLKEAKVVTVFDTSNKVPSTTVLVDTPGLSSPDPQHKQTLVNFLPQADAILLVSDINQQITKSLTDFVKTISLSKRPIYLVLTKCDTKASTELINTKKYISDNIHISIENIACVSANSGELEELYNVFSHIQNNKSKILKEVNIQRVKNISSLLLKNVDELINSTENDTDADEAINRKRYELNKINRNIDNLLESMTSDIRNDQTKACRKFEDVIFDRLDALVAGKSNNFDSDAVSAINNTCSIILNEFKSNVQSILQQKAKERSRTENAIDLHSLSAIDMSQYSIEGLSYNLDLNSIGHEYDGYIATGVKVAGAAAAVAAVVVAAPAAVGVAGGAAGAADTAIGIATVADIADTATDVGSVIANRKAAKRIENAINFAGQAKEQYSNIQNYNQEIAQQVGSNKGIVESLVGFVTDKTMGKPQRRKAIHNYMDATLLPGFKAEIERISNSLSELIKMSLKEEAANTLSEMANALANLQNIKKERKAEFDERMSLLRDYKNQLSII